MKMVNHDPKAITRLFGVGMEEMGLLLFHKKTGGAYNIVCVVIREHDLVPCMVYKSVEDGARWCRPLNEFFDKDRWAWNEKADRIMQMIQSALWAYDPERLKH